jgi:HEAT repeat protein
MRWPVAAGVLLSSAIVATVWPLTAGLTDSCVDWRGVTTAPLAPCLPHRQPLQRCSARSRMYATIPGLARVVNIDPRRLMSPDPAGAACCALDGEVLLMQQLQSQMTSLFKAPGMQGRCLDMMQVLYCSIGCSPQQSTFIRQKLGAPALRPGTDVSIGETCVSPTCANTDGNGVAFSNNNCGSGYHLRPSLVGVPCAASGCSVAECCVVDTPTCADTAGDGTSVAFSSCPSGKHVVLGSQAACSGSFCTVSDCCADNPSCADTAGDGSNVGFSACGLNEALKTNLTVTCQGANCTAIDCCTPVPLCLELSAMGDFRKCGNNCVPRGCTNRVNATNATNGASTNATGRRLRVIQYGHDRDPPISSRQSFGQISRAGYHGSLHGRVSAGVRRLQANASNATAASNATVAMNSSAVDSGVGTNQTCIDNASWRGPGNITCANISRGQWVARNGTSANLTQVWVNGTCEQFTATAQCPRACAACPTASSPVVVVCGAGQYRSFNGTVTTCAMVSNCTASQFEVAPPTKTSDRQCRDQTTCSPSQYETAPPTNTSDRQCTPLTVCNPAEQYTSVASTPVSDRQCDDRVEAVVCFALCQIMFNQCAANLVSSVRDARAFCDLLFHKQQIRVENSSIDIPQFDVNQQQIPHCLYIDTPPLTNVGIRRKRLFLDEAQISVTVSIVDAETVLLPLNYITATATNASLVTLQVRWSYSKKTFVLDMSPHTAVGDTNVSLCARDAGGGSHCDTFLLEVRPFQTPPSLNVPIAGALLEDQTGLVMITILEIDVPPETVTISVTSSNSALLPSSTIQVLGPFEAPCNVTRFASTNEAMGCRFLRMRGVQDLNGETSLFIEANDGVYKANATLRLIVSPSNDPPTITSSYSDMVVEEDAVIPTLLVEAVDDGDPVVNSLTGQMDSGALTLRIILVQDATSVITRANYLPQTTALITGTGPFNFTMQLPQHAFGKAIVSVEVTDGQFVDRKQFHLTVLAVNDAPNISSIPQMTTGEDTPLSILLPLVDVDNAMDQLYLTGQSSNAALLPSQDLRFVLANDTWSLELNPLQNTFGETQIDIAVTDGLLSSSVAFNFTVSSVNDPPVASNIRQQANNSELLVCQFDLNDVETDAAEFAVAPLRMNSQGDSSGQGSPAYVLPCTSPCIYASTSHGILIPLQNIRFGGAGSSRFITIEPNQVMSGEAVVTIHLNDGQNETRFELPYSLVAMTVDVTLTLAGTIEQFDSDARIQAQKDLADAAQVNPADVLIVDVRPGSIILVAAIMVKTADAGDNVAAELARLMSFGKLNVGGFKVENMQVNVVGKTYVLKDWESMNDVWGAIACAILSTVLIMIAAARVILSSESTEDELIHTLKNEIIEKQQEDGDLSLKHDSDEQDSDGADLHSMFHYLEFDIRHLLIWIGAIYEALQLAWIVVDATARKKQWQAHSSAASTVLDMAAQAMLDFRGDVFFPFFHTVLGVYAFPPGLWLALNFLFVVAAGYAVILGAVWNKHGISGRLNRMVASYWTVHFAVRRKLVHHRDELCAVLFDGLMLVPVLRACFKFLTCRFDLQTGSSYEERIKLRFHTSSLYMSDDETVKCWSGFHLLRAAAAALLIVWFMLITIRYTAESKGRPGGAMRFSSRIETARVILLFLLVGVSQVASDREEVVLQTGAAVVLVLLLMNIKYQPSLGSKGTPLNTARSVLLGAVLYTAGLCMLLLAMKDISRSVAIAIAVAAIPFICLCAALSLMRDRRRQRRYTRHIQKALMGGITDAASMHAAGPDSKVNTKQLKDFMRSSIDMLLLVFRAEDSTRRAHAATALGEIALGEDGNSLVINMDGISQLCGLLEDGSPAVRLAALSALGMVATTDDGLDEVGTKTVVGRVDALLGIEDDAHVFSAVAGLLCALMYCHDAEVRSDSLNTLLEMTSHSMSEARESAWSALHKVGVQTEREVAQDEVTAKLIETLLDRHGGTESRIHAAHKLSDVITTVHATDGTKRLHMRDVQRLLAAILCSNDPDFTAGEEGIRLIGECKNLLRLLATTHDARIRSFVIATTLEALTREGNESEGVESFKGEIRDAARRMGVDDGGTEEEIAAGWQEVFREYDDDGNGELDRDEFTRAMRRDCEIPKHKIPDDGLIKLFNQIDVDGGNSIDAAEFSKFLQVPYQPDPAFATLYELASVADLQEHMFRIVRDHMGEHHDMLRREMGAVALEVMSGQPGCIDRLFGTSEVLEAFIRQFQNETNDMVAGALASVLVNFAAEERNLDKLFDAGIFDDLAVAIRGASVAKTESLIELTRGVVKKHASKASSRIVPIFGELIETEQWESCKTAALTMVLNFCDLLPQFCLDTIEMVMGLIEQAYGPSQKLPAVALLGEIAQLPSCTRHVTESKSVHRLIEQLRVETGLRLAEAMGHCLCILASVAPPGEKVRGQAGGKANTKGGGGGLARFKQAAKRVIEHKDMIAFVFSSVMQQLKDQCRFPALTLQQLVAGEKVTSGKLALPSQSIQAGGRGLARFKQAAKRVIGAKVATHKLHDRPVGQTVLKMIVSNLRMQSIADAVLEPKRRLMASDALAIIAAESKCRLTLQLADTIRVISQDLLPYEFGFERVACRALARMAFESKDVCDDVVTVMLECLTASAWAVREGAACTLGLMPTISDKDRPNPLADTSSSSGESPAVPSSHGAHVIGCIVARRAEGIGVDALLHAVRDEESDVAATACLAIANIAASPLGAHAILRSQPSGVQVLTKAMKHMDSNVRAHAAMALGALGSHTREGFEAVQSSFGLQSMVAALRDQAVEVRKVRTNITCIGKAQLVFICGSFLMVLVALALPGRHWHDRSGR